jgi:hypothetical protein
LLTILKQVDHDLAIMQLSVSIFIHKHLKK